MHVGHLRAALPNALFARQQGGVFILRFEDTDMDRQVAKAEKLFLQDMVWLGIEPDESIEHGGEAGPYSTLARHARGDYQAAVQKLLESGRAYECYTSPEELEVMRKLQRSRNEPPRYDNRHRNLSKAEKEKFQQEGRLPVIRFKLEDGDITFHDMIRGVQTFKAENLGGDPVIVRSNGVPLFTLGGVVDDINMGVTHVIRGEDHVANTAQQAQIFQALGSKLPVFAHMPMMLDKDGHKMSKRLGALTIEELSGRGIVPMGLLSYMAGLGFSEVAPTGSVEELARWFDLTNIGRAPVRFDEEQLLRTNAHVLHTMALEEVRPYLAEFLPQEALKNERLPAFWQAARENIKTLADLADLYKVAFEEVAHEVAPQDVEYIQTALSLLPAGPFTQQTWEQWTASLKEKTGRKGKALFLPLRQALTGLNHGPDMSSLLSVIGEEATRERLEKAGACH
jgi:glutamyl-tRNA synthetase